MEVESGMSGMREIPKGGTQFSHVPQSGSMKIHKNPALVGLGVNQTPQKWGWQRTQPETPTAGGGNPKWGAGDGHSNTGMITWVGAGEEGNGDKYLVITLSRV
jgi:hypothetical protein